MEKNKITKGTYKRTLSLVLLMIGLYALIIVSLPLFESQPQNPGVSDISVDRSRNMVVTENVNGADWTSIRLPPYIKPTSYSLHFQTSLVTKRFNGSVEIGLTLSQSSHFVIVHSKQLNVTFGSMTDVSGKEYKFDRIEETAKFEYLTVYFHQPISVGSYLLKLNYEGFLSSALSGYYLSSYKGLNGEKKELATTQFEPTEARKAFPCLDEPGFKATYTISMLLQPTYHALSNMPLRALTKNVNNNGEMMDLYEFEQSPLLSSYLIAFIVSDFEKIGIVRDGVPVNIWTAPGKTRLGEYALRVTPDILTYYEKTFKIKYPFPKLDMIAIPDFAAMENAGLVTYRDTALLFDESSGTANGKQRVATVIAHELSHQWTGDLVSPKWWSDLWLNEGFAEFMEYKAVHFAEPEWKMLDQFIPNDLVRALNADESLYTHMIAVDVLDPASISTLFDDISYGKGSSIIRMLEAWYDIKYGPTVFFEKLSQYLVKFSYSNARTADLWNALSVNGEDVGKFMGTWTDQPGFPYLRFEESTSTGVVVGQSRFTFDSVSVANTLENRQVWAIPLSFKVFSNVTGVPELMTKGFKEVNKLGSTEVEYDIEVDSTAILLANTAQTGVYRSLYPHRTYLTLIDWLNVDIDFLSSVERGALISDVFSMTFSGRLEDPKIALELLSLLKKETSILAWQSGLADIERLKDVFALNQAYGPVLKFTNSIMEGIIDSLGWIETTKRDIHLRGLLRGRILSEAIRNNHLATVKQALIYFKLYKQNLPLNVSMDVVPAILDAGVIYGNLDDYLFVQSKFLNSTYAPDQQMFLHALASSRTPYLQSKTLQFAIDGSVRKQDVISLLRSVATLSPVGHISTYIFIMEQYPALLEIYKTGGLGQFNTLMKDVTASFTKEYLIEEAERVFVRGEDSRFEISKETRISVLKGLETAKVLLRWREKNGVIVENWLNEQ